MPSPMNFVRGYVVVFQTDYIKLRIVGLHNHNIFTRIHLLTDLLHYCVFHYSQCEGAA